MMLRLVKFLLSTGFLTILLIIWSNIPILNIPLDYILIQPLSHLYPELGHTSYLIDYWPLGYQLTDEGNAIVRPYCFIMSFLICGLISMLIAAAKAPSVKD